LGLQRQASSTSGITSYSLAFSAWGASNPPDQKRFLGQILKGEPSWSGLPSRASLRLLSELPSSREYRIPPQSNTFRTQIPAALA
jgi:hypothetical protein